MASSRKTAEQSLLAESGTDKRLPNLDLLRLFAAMMVMVYHLAYTGHASGGANPVAYPELFAFVNQGWTGVSLFFMISGFVIAFSSAHDDPFRFARARFLRLYPAYFFCMCATALVIVLFAKSTLPIFEMSVAKWLANLTMVPVLFGQPFVDGVYWSIVAELVFYGWVAILIWLGVFNQKQRMVLCVWLLLICVNELWLRSGLVNRLFVTQHGCFFILGIMAYRVLVRRAFDWRLDVPILALALALSVVSDMRMVEWMQRHYVPAPEQNHLLSLMRTLFFGGLLLASLRLPPLLSPARCLIIGGLTYPLYLLHANIGFVLFQRFDQAADRWVLLPLIMMLMLAAAVLVHRYVEPALRALFAEGIDRITGWLGNRLLSAHRGASIPQRVKNRQNPA